jgi:hypothetical protein
MGVPRFVAGTLAGALSVPLLLSACGGGDHSIADPPVSPSSSSPTDAPQRESAEHFIQRWAAAEKRMENTGETDTYLRVSGACKACRELAADVQRYYSAGGWIHWGGWRLLSIQPDGTNGSARVFVVKVDSAPTRYKASSASAVQHLPGGASTHQLTIRRIDGAWQMLVKAQVAA